MGMQSSGDTPEPLEASLCWLLNRAAHTLTLELRTAMEDLGVSPRAEHVLATAMTGPHTQIELARKVGLDKTTMVVTLDELERAGLAERRPSPTDRRARVVAVTEAGERTVRAAEEIVRRVHENVLSVLPASERAAFVAALAKLVRERLEPAAVVSE